MKNIMTKQNHHGWVFWHPVGGIQEDTFATTKFMAGRRAAIAYHDTLTQQPETTLRHLKKEGGQFWKVRLERVE